MSRSALARATAARYRILDEKQTGRTELRHHCDGALIYAKDGGPPIESYIAQDAAARPIEIENDISIERVVTAEFAVEH